MEIELCRHDRDPADCEVCMLARAGLQPPPEAAQEGIAAVQGSTPVDRLGSMSPRARWALKCAGITTLEAAAARPDEELLAIPRAKACNS